MRWFVEVSRVGESEPAEKYCVEAKAWQAALQEARKLRGDSGPLSKFSIELLDQGYRAVDAELKVRYFVNNAPADAPLTDGNGSSGSLVVAAKSVPAESAKKFPDAAPFTLVAKSGSKPPAASAASSAPVAHAPAAFPAVNAAMSEPAAAGNNVGAVSKSVVPRPRPSNAPRPRSAPPAQPNIVVPADPVPRAPRVPSVFSSEPPVPAQAFVAPATPAAIAAPVSAAPAPVSAAPAPVSAVPAPVSAVPGFQVIRERAEEPRAESPITYRELALAVELHTTRSEAEALLWAQYRQLAATIAARTPGKFIQLAIFDHTFKKKPERPPLATLAWKDWRGDPVLAFPGFGDAAAGPLSGVPASQTPSTLPTGVAPTPLPAQPANHFPIPVQAPVVLAAPVVELAPAIVAPAPAVAAPVAAVVTQAPAVVPESPPPSAAPAIASVIVDRSAVATAPTVLNLPVVPTAPASAPSNERPSRPRIATAARRRAPGEDLIGDLFETMHELHFMRDIAVGADFVLTVLNEVLPCEGVLLHVFDINSRNFVVVRAKGAHPRDVLLSRLSDQDALCMVVMRALSAVSLANVSQDARFAAPRWQTVGVAPRVALCGAVRQGGRYLGMIELVNPLGDLPFHEGEINALDYICEQFAEFLVNRPIVLDADVVLGR
ncbi:MAG TPA: hypothetical protein VGM29_06380 [Polyangiaceae bacterium]